MKSSILITFAYSGISIVKAMNNKISINRFALDENDINIIINGSIYLESLIELVNDYKKKKKPMVAPVRKLSIFN